MYIFVQKWIVKEVQQDYMYCNIWSNSSWQRQYDKKCLSALNITWEIIHQIYCVIWVTFVCVNVIFYCLGWPCHANLYGWCTKGYLSKCTVAVAFFCMQAFLLGFDVMLKELFASTPNGTPGLALVCPKDVQMLVLPNISIVSEFQPCCWITSFFFFSLQSKAHGSVFCSSHNHHFILRTFHFWFSLHFRHAGQLWKANSLMNIQASSILNACSKVSHIRHLIWRQGLP